MFDQQNIDKYFGTICASQKKKSLVLIIHLTNEKLLVFRWH